MYKGCLSCYVLTLKQQTLFTVSLTILEIHSLQICSLFCFNKHLCMCISLSAHGSISTASGTILQLFFNWCNPDNYSSGGEFQSFKNRTRSRFPAATAFLVQAILQV